MKKFEIRLLGKPDYPFGQRVIKETRVMHGDSENEIHARLIANRIFEDYSDFVILETR